MFHLIFPVDALNNKPELLRETKQMWKASGLVWEEFLGKSDLKSRWDLERAGKRIQWHHDISKNVEAELAQNVEGR